MKRVFVLCLLMLTIKMIKAQSYHFSQFFSTPLLTNPANTGFMDGPYRVASNLRSQGRNGGSQYFTGYVSGDISLLSKYISEGHRAGIGAYIMNDRSLGGALQTSSAGVSLAYHVGFDKFGDKSLGLGFQGTYNQRRLDYNRLSYGNQFGNDGFDPSLPIGEVFNATNRTYLDANIGAVYNGRYKDKAFFAGGSIYNVIRHKDNILPEEFRMPTRIVLQSGLQLIVNENSRIYTSLTHMSQAKASETTLGGAFGLQLNEKDVKNEISMGLWYRYKDAVIPYIGYYYDGFQFGLSYDYTVSALKTGAQVRNGYELTLIYKPIDKTKLRTTIPWY